jgi:hypothetical protein
VLRANSLQGEGEDAARGGWRCCLGLGELLPSEAHRRSSPEVFAEAAAAFFFAAEVRWRGGQAGAGCRRSRADMGGGDGGLVACSFDR